MTNKRRRCQGAWLTDRGTSILGANAWFLVSNRVCVKDPHLWCFIPYSLKMITIINLNKLFLIIKIKKENKDQTFRKMFLFTPSVILGNQISRVIDIDGEVVYLSISETSIHFSLSKFRTYQHRNNSYWWVKGFSSSFFVVKNYDLFYRVINENSEN